MPYRRRRGVPRKNKKTYGSRLNKRQASQVKRMIRTNQEYKFISIAAAGQSVSSAPTIVRLSSMAQGLGDQDRIGDSIRLLRFQLRAHFVCGDSFNTCRMIIFQWKPMESGFPADSDILLPGPTSASDILSQYQTDTKPQFSIIYDTVFRLIGDGNSGSPFGPASTHYINRMFYPKLKKVQFRAGSSTIMSNGLFGMFISDSTSSVHPQFAFTIKLIYTDA